MAETMLAAVLTGPESMELREIPRPEAKAGEVLVRISCVGVCGSDLHMFGQGKVETPPGYFVLGHEAAGVVEAVGEGVTSRKLGDRVALEPASSCGECEYCKTGLYNLCPSVQMLSVAGQRRGVLAQYAAHPASLCHLLPDSVGMLEGAMIEPLAVGLHATAIGNAGLGMDAVIFGAGCIGLVNLLALKARGVSRVAMVDMAENRLAKARQLGADLTLNPREDVAAAILGWTNGRGVDLAVDATGNPAAIGRTESVVRKAGMIVLAGNPAGPMPPEFDLLKFVRRELTMKGVFRYRNLYPTAIRAVEAGTIPVREIPDRVYPFEDSLRAFRDSIDHKDQVVKAVIEL